MEEGYTSKKEIQGIWESRPVHMKAKNIDEKVIRKVCKYMLRLKQTRRN